MDYRDENDWYLLSNGFRKMDGYYIHFDRKIVVTDEVAMDFPKDKVKNHVDVSKENLTSFIFSRYPKDDVISDILKRYEWDGKKEIISLLNES